MLRATLTNNAGKIVTHVGVLVGPQEYEFPVRIQPHDRTAILTGLPDQNYPRVAVTQTMRGPISDDACWARWVDFADGSNYRVSPL